MEILSVGKNSIVVKDERMSTGKRTLECGVPFGVPEKGGKRAMLKVTNVRGGIATFLVGAVGCQFIEEIHLQTGDTMSFNYR